MLIPFRPLALGLIFTSSILAFADGANLEAYKNPHAAPSTWKVGDQATFQVTFETHNQDTGQVTQSPAGTMVMTATREEGDGVWVETASDIQMKIVDGQPSVSEHSVVDTLVDRKTGKYLRKIQDGKDVGVTPDERVLASEEVKGIEVLGAKFDTVHQTSEGADKGTSDVWYTSDERGAVLLGIVKMRFDVVPKVITMNFELKGTIKK